MLALGPPFIESVVAWQARKKPQPWRSEGRLRHALHSFEHGSIPVEKLLEMRLARRLKQNKQTSGLTKRDFGVFESASWPQMARILEPTLFFKLQILIVKLRVD